MDEGQATAIGVLREIGDREGFLLADFWQIPGLVSGLVSGRFLAGCWQAIGRLLADCWQTFDRLLTGCRQVFGRFSAGFWRGFWLGYCQFLASFGQGFGREWRYGNCCCDRIVVREQVA